MEVFEINFFLYFEIEFLVEINVNSWLSDFHLFIHVIGIFFFVETDKGEWFLGFLVIFNL